MRLLEGRRANEPITESLNLKSRLASRSNIEILDSNSAVLFAPGDALRLNRPYQVQVVEREVAIDDYASIRATRRVGQRLVYSVDSTLAAATTQQLRTAPTVYPEWAERYIELPEMPPRVLEFAARLAETGETAVDRARAAEFFMRRFPFARTRSRCRRTEMPPTTSSLICVVDTPRRSPPAWPCWFGPWASRLG